MKLEMARQNLIAFIIVMVLLGLGGELRAQDCRDDHLQRECSVRDGLPNIAYKLAQNQDVRVAFLGGSITAQAGWRKYTMEWLQEEFQQSICTEINAAIGGTASDFGAYRLTDQVLKYSPDLIFVEFAVNDSKKTREITLKAMEGIVRQVYLHDPYIDICFVYTIKDAYLKDEINGILPPSKQAMEEVADHYGITTINFGAEIANLVCSHRLAFEGALKQDTLMVFSRDGVHPYVDTGHQLYFSILKRNMQKALQHTPSKYKHRLPPPLSKEHFVHAKMIDVAEVYADEQWQLIPCATNSVLNKFSEMLPYVWKTEGPDAALTFKFKGTGVGIYDVIGPSSVQTITIEIDGVKKDIPRFDAYCSYHRMGYFLIDGLEESTHKVTLNVNTEPFDKRIILSSTGRKMDDPTAYGDNNLYLGKILINGDLIK